MENITAVEYLIEKLKKIDLLLFEEKITGITYFEEKEKLIIQAKEMEKEQMIDFANDWFSDGNYIAEDYFNKIFNK